MLKVLVVEDEEMIRKGIVLAVDWAALDCVVVAEAANGEEALAVSAHPYHHRPENAQNGRAGDAHPPAPAGQPRLCHHPHRL